jgi:hypothetical protein
MYSLTVQFDIFDNPTGQCQSYLLSGPPIAIPDKDSVIHSSSAVIEFGGVHLRIGSKYR